MKRRTFLQMSGLSTLPLLGQRFSWAQQATNADGKILICLFLRGGVDGLNVVVPAGDNDYYALRPTIAIPEPGSGAGAAIDLDGYFGLHPSLQPLMKYYDQGELACVQAIALNNNTHSHFDAMDLMERGITELDVAFDGWLNRHLVSKGGGGETFRAVGMGTAVQRSLSGTFPAIGINRIENFGLVAPDPVVPALKNTLAELFPATSLLDLSAQTAITAMDELTAINPGQYPPENGALYPETDFGYQFMELGQLIRADIGLETACIDIGGWDHHDQENQYLPGLLDELARTLDAFATDMGPAMQDITIVAMSEFGRRAFENASGGTDHGHGNMMLVLGGGLNGGQVFGEWPGLDAASLVSNGDLAATNDYRTVLAEILENRFGEANIGAVFPDYLAEPYLGVTA